MESGGCCHRSPNLEDVADADVPLIESGACFVLDVLIVDLDDRLRDRLELDAVREDGLVVRWVAGETGRYAALRVEALVADVRRERALAEMQHRGEIVAAF